MSTQKFRGGISSVIAVAVLALGLATVSSPSAAAATSAPTPSTPNAEVADQRLVVGLEPGASTADAAAIAARAGVSGADVVDDHTIVVDAPPGGVRTASAEELAQDPRVKYVEPNYKITTSFTPNDPALPSLGTLLDAQPGGIRAQSAWSTTLGSRDIVVGVLDSGIDTTHPDLVGNLWSNRRGIGGCAYGSHGYNAFTKRCTTGDLYGHGTHVSGIIGAVGNNGVGITGVAPRVSLMSLAMLDRNGDGSIAGAISAIDWAVKAKQRGVNLRVLSASWGGVGYSQGLADAIQRAGDAGLLFVAAAGNSGVSVENEPVYPCAVGLPNVVCVAATQDDDHLTNFSDYGATHVDIAAPGESIVSTVPRGVVPGCGQSLYCALDGTSMAAPMVSGTAVLAVAANPTLTVTQLRALLVQSVDPKSWLSGKVVSGGRLNVCKAVPGCQGTTATPPTAPNRLSVQVEHGKATLQWTVPVSNGNGSGVNGYRIDSPTGTRTVSAGTRSVTISGLTDNTNAQFSVRSRNTVGESVPVMETGRLLSGGFVVDGAGQVGRVRLDTGPLPSATTPTPLTAADGQARGIALLPDGTGGYVLDGSGGLHPFGVGGNPKPAAATGERHIPHTDWARGVALMPDGTSGYVLDGAGNLYGFSIGDNHRPPAATGGPQWPGADIARGFAITPSGKGGYVVDAFGNIYRFGIGGAALPMVASGGPSWPTADTARGLSLVRGEGGGYIIDRSGGLHPFRTRGNAPAKVLERPSWPGLDVARGIAL